ncbi:hypothetical protein JCGZ_24085 [Jatropha curcas]|uniref:Uncharacterized protein n=1 Tax=Jatropha curcas TaxID=180498 RepID=A0A067LEH7_JATCU|nr:hypothetical protein JCGZ_24085 [Jatropha curcas]
MRVIVGNGVASITPQLEDLIDRALGLGPATVSQNNYEIEISQADMSDDRDHEERKVRVRDKPHISKAERRKLKKGQKSDVGDANDDEKEESKENNVSVNSQPETSIQNNKAGGGKISREQKSKLKKMKEKYANQDGEERSIRMAYWLLLEIQERNMKRHKMKMLLLAKGNHLLLVLTMLQKYVINAKRQVLNGC